MSHIINPAQPAPITRTDLRVMAITVLAHCSDGRVRAVRLPVTGAKRLLGFITHNLCGGVLQLTRETIAVSQVPQNQPGEISPVKPASPVPEPLADGD